MATSDGTSGPTRRSPLGLWTQSSPPSGADASESIIVAATSTSPTTGKGNIEGRVGKSGGTRRRTRASRRAPTTMLNTDTANFRSMVQQFTGIVSGPYPAYPPAVHSNMIRGYNFNQPISSSSSVIHRPSVMPMDQLQQQYHYYAPNRHGHGQAAASQNESFFVPEYSNNVSSSNLEEVGDEFFADAMYAQWMPASRPTSNPNIKVDDDFYF